MAQEVVRVTVGDNMHYGITYSLPRTLVKVRIEATCTQVKAGSYAPYAERFLGLAEVAQHDQTSWTIDQITMTPVGVADTTRTYHINFPEKGALPTFHLTADRCLLSINRAPMLEAPVAEEEPAPQKPVKELKASDVMNPEILKAGSKAKQADLAAQEVFGIRESRNELVKGEADNMPADGLSLQLMLETLDAQERALLTLFKGVTTSRRVVHELYFDPSVVRPDEVLFRFSPQLGFVDADDLAGEPYYVGIQLLEDNRMPVLTDPKAKKKVEKGLPFCVPGKARVTLSSVSETLAQGDIPVAQFGHVEQLPQAQFTDKKKPTSAAFAPLTGAIRIFEN